MDEAITNFVSAKGRPNLAEQVKIAEIPFDFERRMVSVILRDGSNKAQLICKVYALPPPYSRYRP